MRVEIPVAAPTVIRGPPPAITSNTCPSADMIAVDDGLEGSYNPGAFSHGIGVLSDAATVAIRLTINGQPFEGAVSPRLLLSDFLRENVGLTGVRVCCEQGICGACTILVDGQTVRGMPDAGGAGRRGRRLTVEGLASLGRLHPLQQAFWDHHGLQCGYCTPGMLITAYELLEQQSPIRSEIRGPRGDCREHLPVHGLRPHRDVDPGRGPGHAGRGGAQ